MLNTIILDFDGVIVESVSVKTEAFRELFSFTPQYVDEIVEFHKKNGGMSRFDKFRYIYKNILKIPLTDQNMQTLSEQFSSLVVKKVISASFVPGADAFIKKYHTEKSLFVVSATPQPELEFIIEKKGICKYFKEVMGSPETKENHIKKILSYSNITKDSVIFIGDSMNDWKAARDAKIRFVARVTPESQKIFLNKPFIECTVSDLHELDRYIEDCE